MSRLRVVHIINDMEVGGAQRQVLNLFRAIDRERFDLQLICLATKGGFGREIEALGFPVLVLGKNRRVQFRMLFQLIRELRGRRPDIVHCSVFTANLWGRVAARLARVPVLIAHEQSTVSLERLHRRLIDRVLAPATHRVLAVSEDLRRRILAEEKLAAAGVEVLYNAVDCDAVEKTAARGRPDLPGRAGRRVGIVGRLEYRKDHLTFLRAAAQVASEMPDATFLMVGDGPERTALDAEIMRLNLENHAVLLGERDDVPEILPELDVYVLSSITEGLSLSILEAMAAGRPIVTTRVGGNPELLDEGRAGVLVPPGNPRALAQAVMGLLADPESAAELGRRARRRAREVFDIGPVTRRLEEIYVRGVSEARSRK